MDNAVEGITPEDYHNISDIVDSVAAFSRMTYKSVYIIDYYKKNFLYVSDNPLYLCGLSANEVKETGYKFYIDNVPQEDVERLLKINEAGFRFSRDIPADAKRHYTLSYNFRIINTDHQPPAHAPQDASQRHYLAGHVCGIASHQGWKRRCCDVQQPHQRTLGSGLGT